MRRSVCGWFGSVVMVAVCVLLCAPVLGAQDKPVEKPAATEARPGAGESPVLTEADTLRVQLIALRIENAQMQLAYGQSQTALGRAALDEARAAREALLVEIEKRHPGWAINRESGAWVKVPAPPSDPPKPAPPVKK